MGKFDGILICSDVDGTFRRNEKTFAVNAEAVKYFKDNGGKFTFATGRGIEHMGEKTFRDVFNAPVCLYNGGVVYDYENECILRERHTDITVGEIVKGIYEQRKEISEFHIFHSCDEGVYYSDLSDVPESVLMLKPIKIICVSETAEKADKFKEFALKQEILKSCYISKSWSKGVEFNSVDATKGTGLKFIKSYLGNIHTAIGIGDYGNDITLLEAADIGVAVGDALEELKQAADMTVKPCNEFAIADLIELLDKEHKM